MRGGVAIVPAPVRAGVGEDEDGAGGRRRLPKLSLMWECDVRR